MRSLIACIACGLAASEERIEDLVLGIELLPQSVRWRWHDDIGTRNGSDTVDHATAVLLGVRWGRGPTGRAWLVWAGTAVLWHEQAWGDLHWRGPAAALEGGGAWAPADGWLIGAGPWAALGHADGEADTPASQPLQLAGSLRAEGFRAWLRWRPGGRWSATMGAGWLQVRTHLAGDNSSLELHQRGTWASVGLNCTLDPLPMTLE